MKFQKIDPFAEYHNCAVILYAEVRVLLPAQTLKIMPVEISNSDFKQLMSLMGRAVTIIKDGSPKPRDYNVARQLGLLKKKFEKRNVVT